tara:strand:- start:229 stop:594 length:366 start_codon:yes stop_codon:yes gene_type:complete
MSTKNPRETLLQRRELRRNQTKAEEILWNEVRGKKLGIKFKRQFGIGPYILDFYVPRLKLAIEVDGKIHLKRDVRIKDKNREEYLLSCGICVLRFKNEDVENGLDRVLFSLREKIQAARKE